MAPSIASLLGLPREVRDQISFSLIADHGTKSAPPSPPFAGRRTKGDSDEVQNIMFPVDHFILRYPPLFLVNRQLCDEVRENAHCLKRTGKQVAELDVMAKGYTFYPTFTILPACLQRGCGFDLNVNLRIFSTEAFRQVTVGWQQHPGSGFSSLLTLLNNLLISGPTFACPPKDTNGKGPVQEPYRIDTLNFSISFHDLYTPSTWPSTTHEIFRLLKCFASSGIPFPYVRRIGASVSFTKALPDAASSIYNQSTWDMLSQAYSVEKGWPVAETCNMTALKHCEQDGFRFALRNQKVGTVALSGLRRLGTGS